MRKKILLLLVILQLHIHHIKAQEQNLTTEPKLVGSENFQSQPEYPGGMTAFNTYITSSTTDYDQYKGKWMIITFTIKSDGTVENISIIKSINRRVDKQVIKIMKNCKKWKPAYKDNTPVDVEISLPIRF